MARLIRLLLATSGQVLLAGRVGIAVVMSRLHGGTQHGDRLRSAAIDRLLSPGPHGSPSARQVTIFRRHHTVGCRCSRRALASGQNHPAPELSELDVGSADVPQVLQAIPALRRVAGARSGRARQGTRMGL